MPDGDFFWNAWRTYTAFSNSNGVHGSIGVSVVRLDDLQDARTEPLPRLRRRRGTAELRDTESVAHVLLDRRRKAQEIALGGPDPMQRFLVGSRDTSHLKIIPVLGYSNKCVISAMTSRGGNRRGNRASRGVFPSAASSPVLIASDAKAAGRAGSLFQLQSAPRLTDRALRAALFAARTNSTPPARRSMTVPWRERPRDLAGVCDHRPRPQQRSLTPRCLCLSRSRRSPRCDRRSPQRRAQSAPSLHRPSHSIVRFAVARSRRSALLRPRMRAAGGLDRPIREPLESNYRRPRCCDSLIVSPRRLVRNVP